MCQEKRKELTYLNAATSEWSKSKSIMSRCLDITDIWTILRSTDPPWFRWKKSWQSPWVELIFFVWMIQSAPWATLNEASLIEAELIFQGDGDLSCQGSLRLKDLLLWSKDQWQVQLQDHPMASIGRPLQQLREAIPGEPVRVPCVSSETSAWTTVVAQVAIVVMLNLTVRLTRATKVKSRKNIYRKSAKNLKQEKLKHFRQNYVSLFGKWRKKRMVINIWVRIL